jgi:hypothetical protein
MISRYGCAHSVLSFLVLGYLFSRYVEPSSVGLGFLAGHDAHRLVLALPLLRLLSCIRSLRVMVLGLMFVLPNYKVLALQLLCLFYMYGALGCIMFARGFVLLPNFPAEQSAFDSFLESQMTLYQLLVGANWTTVFLPPHVFNATLQNCVC